MNRYAVVAGGVNIDIGAASLDVLVPHDSNPGHITFSIGGVGCNIARNIALLRMQTVMLTAVGNDYNGKTILAALNGAGINTEHILASAKDASSTYLYINSPDGEMELAVNDMEICERLDVDYFQSKLELMNGAKFLVIDANLPAESIKFLCENVKVPIYADSVSTVKAAKLIEVLSHLTGIKANGMEAETLLGLPCCGDESMEAIAKRLLKKGVKKVFISIGEGGMIAADSERLVHVPAYKTGIVSTTGAGDACMAAIAYYDNGGKRLEEVARFANLAAAVTIESAQTVNENLSCEVIEERNKLWN